MSKQYSVFTTVCLLVMFMVALMAGVSAQTSSSATAGFNLNASPSQPPMDVDWIPNLESWRLQVDLIFDPTAGPMQKQFKSPTDASGGPIQLDDLQPFPQMIWENFQILPPSPAVSDWHEEIHTPGWEWVLPNDSRFPDLFLPNESLITMNGNPWPWSPIPMPGTTDPAKLWVEFEPIPAGNVLDVHKALLWVGTPGNRIWGDQTDDAGNLVDESLIDVWEYPTPEPATAGLLCAAMLVLLGRRRGH